MRRFFIFLGKVFQSIFGSFHWESPQWLRPLSKSLRRQCGEFAEFYNKHPKKVYSIAAGVFIGVALASGGYYWYKNRPQPVKMSVRVSEIAPTALKKDSQPSPLILTFGGSAAKLQDVGKEVTKGLTIQPPIEGTWKWEEDSRLVFRVQEDWTVGKSHQVLIEKSLIPKHVHLEKYEIPFSTPKFKADIENANFYQNPKNSEDKKAVVEVGFSHPVDKESLEERISMTYLLDEGEGRSVSEKPLKFSVKYDKFAGKAYIHSQRLDLPVYTSKVKVQIDKAVVSRLGGEGTDYELSKSITIPGMLTHFQITEADLTLVRNKKYEPEQALVLSMTTAANQQNLSKNLEVYQLPKDRPAQPGEKKPRKNFYWTPGSVSQAILDVSQKVDLQEIPTENDNATVISFKYTVKPGRFLYIRVKKGLKAFGGYELAESAQFVKKVPEYPKELKIMGAGSILSLNGDKKLSVLARDLEAVRYRAQRVLPGQIAHMVTQSRGSLKDPDFKSYYFDFENITETFSEVKRLPQVGLGKTQYSYFDFTNALIKADGQPKGLYYLIAESWDIKNGAKPSSDFSSSYSDYQHDSRASSSVVDKRLILVTDIGILAKKSIDGGYDLFLQSIATGSPIANARVEVLGQNGLPILNQQSDSRGHVRFDDLDSFEDEKEPAVFVVKKSGDLSFLPVNSHINDMNYSRFDVGGVVSQGKQTSLQAYMFSDRGIYRPGEKINIGYVVKDGDWSKDLTGVQVEMMITDPRGTLLRHEKDLALNRVGLQSYDFQTQSSWPTGYYNFTLRIKNKERVVRLGSTRVKVEEFMPDRLKIATRFSTLPKKGWLKPEGLKGLVSLKNLFGTAAQNRRVTGNLNLSPSYPSFHSLKEWSFHDPKKAERGFQEPLGDKTTNDDGEVEFDFNLDKFESASYLLRFVAEGFEMEGGRSVIGSNSVLISPLDYLVGFKKGGDLNFIKKNAEVPVDFIAVNPDLDKIGVENLQLKIVEFRQVSTLVKQSNGTFKYESVAKKYDQSTQDFSINKEGTRIQLDTSKPGDFAVLIVNEAGLEMNRVNYSVTGASNLTYDLEKNSELQVRLDKKDYNPGDTIEISIRGPYVGAGLITIEREKVYAYKWFKTDSKSSIQKIQVPKDLEGNGYVNVSFVRSLDSNEIFMSPLSAGIAPFSINKASRINELTLDIPALVRPGEELKMAVKAQRPGKALVFAVNEGILQVANYKTPDPLNHFYKKRALEVQTRQILDLILPEFSRLSQRRSSEGGGMAASKLGQNLNPFKRLREKSVAYWSGVVDVGPQHKQLVYKVPDHFSGQLRVMAVVVSPESMDATSDKTLVRGHFVLSPNVPTFVAPNDKLTISVGVSNNVEGSGQQAPVEVELSTSKNIKVIGDNKAQLKIDEGSEASVTFTIEAKQPLGNANFIFRAQHADKSSQRTVTSSVRPAQPYITSLQAGYVEKGQSKNITTPRRLYKNFSTNEVSVSKLPFSLAKGLMSFLKKYPYGCTEQITSKSFPALVLSEHKEFQMDVGSLAEQVQGVTEIFASRQDPDGALSMWPGGSEVSAFHTAYAVHYLTEAKMRGHRIPNELMVRALNYLKDYSESPPKNLAMARVQAYAAYLLTQNERIATQALSNLEKWIDGFEDPLWVKDILVLYMAASYKNMQATTKATKLISRFDADSKVKSDYEYGIYDDAIKRATYLYIVSKHFPERLGEVSTNDLQVLVDQLNRGYNTVSSALSVLAFQAYGEKVGFKSTDKVKVTQVIESKATPLNLVGDLFPKSSFDRKTAEVTVSNNSEALTFYSVTQAGFDKEKTPEINNGIEVFREFLDSEGEGIKTVSLGDEVTVRLRLRTLSKDFAYHVAVVDLLPGGFEVVLDSIQTLRAQFNHVDAREDRVLLFTSFTPEAKTFEYKIKAINKGNYKVPPIFAESMYDKSLQTKGSIGAISIE